MTVTPDDFDPRNVPVENGVVTISLTFRDVETLDEAIGEAAAELMRSGLDGFHIHVRDTDRDKTYIVREGEVLDMDTLQALADDEDDDDDTTLGDTGDPD